MPSQVDNSYNWEYSRPSFDSPEEELRQQAIHEADTIFEMRPPREPTREEELEYIKW